MQYWPSMQVNKKQINNECQKVLWLFNGQLSTIKTNKQTNLAIDWHPLWLNTWELCLGTPILSVHTKFSRAVLTRRHPIPSSLQDARDSDYSRGRRRKQQNTMGGTTTADYICGWDYPECNLNEKRRLFKHIFRQKKWIGWAKLRYRPYKQKRRKDCLNIYW